MATWQRNNVDRSVVIATVTLAAGESSNNIELPNFQDKTVHIYGGTFGDSTISLKGMNDASATPLDLHRTNDTSLTFSSVGSAVLAHMLENPRYLQATASGTTGTGLVVSVIAVTPRN